MFQFSVCCSELSATNCCLTKSGGGNVGSLSHLFAFSETNKLFSFLSGVFRAAGEEAFVAFRAGKFLMMVVTLPAGRYSEIGFQSVIPSHQ
jgi:hypothetical protein